MGTASRETAVTQKRKRIIVEGFQARFVATEVAWLAVCFALFVAVLTGPLVWQMNAGSASAQDLTRATTLLQLNDRLWIPLLALFLGVTWTLVRLSHRVAGPLYRFRQVFAQVAAGDLRARVRVRERDYLVSEGEAFDGMIGAVRERVRRAQASAAAVQSALGELSGRTAKASPARIAAIAARAAETEAILAEFLVVPDDPEAAAAPATAAATGRARPRLELSVAQTLAVALLFLIALAAVAVPAYTAALDHARVMRSGGHRTVAAAAPAPASPIVRPGRKD